MDSKERLIQNIILKMSSELDERQIEILKNVLIMEMNEIDVKDVCRDVTVSENNEIIKLLNIFISSKRLEGLSESSLKRYYDQNLKLLEFIHKDKISDICTNDIRYYLATCKQRNNLSDNTVYGMKRCISAMFSFLTIEEYIIKNPCLKLGKFKVQQKIRESFNNTDIQLIRKNCKTDRDKALVEILLSTGVRVSECSNITLSDINWNQKEIKILGKGNKERIAYINSVTEKALTKYLNKYDSYSSTLFGLSKSGIEQMLKRVQKRSNVENIHPHRFRRTFCTKTLEIMPIQDVSKLMGHNAISTTQIYDGTNQSLIKKRYMECMNGL